MSTPNASLLEHIMANKTLFSSVYEVLLKDEIQHILKKRYIDDLFWFYVDHVNTIMMIIIHLMMIVIMLLLN